LLLIRVARAPNASPEGVAALAASATLMMSPFVLDYDCAVAAIPLAWLFSEGVRRGFWPWEKIILVLAYLLPLLSRPIALTTGIPIAPIVLAALLLSVARAAAPRRAAFGASSALSGGPESGAPAIT
jgi:hypothetical protein